MTRPAGRSTSSRPWAALGVIVTAYGAMLAWTWRAWPDPLVDFGRELYGPWQVSTGRVLYRDLAWLSGPLSVYANALWFRIWGVSVGSLFAADIAVTLVLIAILFRLLSDIASRAAATIALTAFVMLFACNQAVDTGNYNFTAPYSHELTHGVVLAFAAIACFGALLRRSHAAWAASSGFALGCAFLTKAEVFAAGSAALVCGLVAAWRTGAIPQSRVVRTSAVFIGSLAVPPAVTFVLFARVVPSHDALLDTVGAWRYIAGAGVSQLFYRRVAGLVDPVASLRVLALASVTFVTLFGAAAGAAWLVRRTRDRALVVGLAGAAGLAATALAASAGGWDLAARALPIVMLACAIVPGIRLVRRREDAVGRTRSLLQFTVAIFALALLGRLGLNVVLFGYGFALAMPAALVTIVALVAWTPSWLSRIGANGPFFRSFAIAAVGALVASQLLLTSAHLAKKHAWIGSGDDAFRADSRATAINAALGDISTRLTPDQTLVVLPEGVMLNYLLRRRNPTPYINFMPPELGAFGEDPIASAFAAHPPDFIVLAHKDTSEYGVRFFGRDYGGTLDAWVRAHYTGVAVFGATPFTSDRFGLELMQRSASR